MALRVRSRDARSGVGVGFRVPGSGSTRLVSGTRTRVGLASFGSCCSRAFIVFIGLIEPATRLWVVLQHSCFLRLILVEHVAETVNCGDFSVCTDSVQSVSIDRINRQMVLACGLNVPR